MLAAGGAAIGHIRRAGRGVVGAALQLRYTVNW
jgi:hypothetical protein